MFVWRILWIVGIVAFILGSYYYAEQGVARTLDTLRTKRDLSQGKTSPETWKLILDDKGTVLEDSNDPRSGKVSPRNVLSIPALQNILNDATLNPVNGEVILNKTLYIYAAQRNVNTGTTRILLDPYSNTAGSPWTL